MVVANGWKTNEQVTREYYNGNFEENIQALANENAISNGVLTKSGNYREEKEDDGNSEE